MITNPQFSQANAQAHVLCSLRTALRVLLAVNAALCTALLMVATGWRDAAEKFFVAALWLEPASLLCTAALCFLSRRNRAGWFGFAALSACMCWVLAALTQLLQRGFSLDASVQAAGVGWVFGSAGWWLMNWQAKSAAPALQEADLRSLGAAMRPHFFFNALNAVMGLIRVNPRRAEDMLQDTAELFRDVMAQDQHRLVTVEAELDTTRRYARIEQARLDERLSIEWRIDAALLGAFLPPFTLQLLLENAVRHGIEPLPAGGRIEVAVQRQGQQLQLEVRNPFHAPSPKPALAAGAEKHKASHNGMALANLRQRLALLYDQSAQLTCVLEHQMHTATVVIPLEFEA